MPEYYLDYAACRSALLKRLREPPPGRIQLLTGPRQVGKTTLLRGLLEFCTRYPRYRPLIVAAPGDEPQAHRLGLSSINWSDFLLAGPPAPRNPRPETRNSKPLGGCISFATGGVSKLRRSASFH
jgi:hypothetical protein